jgi:hypothetical protein
MSGLVELVAQGQGVERGGVEGIGKWYILPGLAAGASVF